MAASKKPSKDIRDKRGTSPAEFRKAEEASWRKYKETKRNPKDAAGNSYFGGNSKTGTPKLPDMKFPPGTPITRPPKKSNPSSPKPKNPSTTPPKHPNPPTTVPKGLAQSSLKKKKK